MATKAKKSAARKSAAKRPATSKSTAKKPGGKKPAGKKPAGKKPSTRRGSAVARMAMSVAPEPAPQKPKSNFCEDHGRLLRSDRTCPISTCRYHTQPMPQ